MSVDETHLIANHSPPPFFPPTGDVVFKIEFSLCLLLNIPSASQISLCDHCRSSRVITT